MYRPILALVLFAGLVLGQYPINVVELCKAVPGRIGSHFVRDPRNCSNIFNCDADLSFPVMMSCGYNLHFSQSQQVCVYKNSDYDDCGKRVAAGKYKDPVCGPRPNGANRDPASCNRFILCWKGNSFPSMKCQGNLQFSFDQGKCVAPGSARCLRNNQG